MDTPFDLFGARRAELADLILAPRDRITDLERHFARQEEEHTAPRAVVAPDEGVRAADRPRPSGLMTIELKLVMGGFPR